MGICALNKIKGAEEGGTNELDWRVNERRTRGPDQGREMKNGAGYLKRNWVLDGGGDRELGEFKIYKEENLVEGLTWIMQQGKMQTVSVNQ